MPLIFRRPEFPLQAPHGHSPSPRALNTPHTFTHTQLYIHSRARQRKCKDAKKKANRGNDPRRQMESLFGFHHVVYYTYIYIYIDRHSSGLLAQALPLPPHRFLLARGKLRDLHFLSRARRNGCAGIGTSALSPPLYRWTKSREERVWCCTRVSIVGWCLRAACACVVYQATFPRANAEKNARESWVTWKKVE